MVTDKLMLCSIVDARRAEACQLTDKHVIGAGLTSEADYLEPKWIPIGVSQL